MFHGRSALESREDFKTSGESPSMSTPSTSGPSSATSDQDEEAEELKMAGRTELIVRELENELRDSWGCEEKRYEVLATMCHLLGRVVIDAVGLLESRSVKRVSDSSGRHTLIEVCPKTTGFAYQLYPKINYCLCAHFQDKVIKEQSSFTCEHVMAARLAECVNGFVNETKPHIEGMFERLQRFIPEIY
uniref:SWIM-type domain-containing protein n=1 Tax=Steinernema glaseri TaxID=37863 RepID=A0A1I7YDD8_9BILA